ncbi:Rho GTPase activating protein [Fusarium irregulare]|uniref:Rho GTPase activating protein n=1 Tax=Fusarium irregulare TaxID=2494466 RepID=A0A9W8PDL4_9HYPO|nr:Rho GTPase activating protein [Fusarium irregulare]KAJ4004185.1 Rho GTPase activating protein [Fusarium irregulare]
MPQLALQSQSVEASVASANNSVTTPVESNFLDRARSPVEVPVGDSPTVGRVIRASPSLPSFSLGSLSPASRSPRPAISSPLKTASNFPYQQASPSPRSTTFPSRSTPTPTYRTNTEPETSSSLVKETSFLSDSSDEGSPEPPLSPRQGYTGSPNGLRTVSEPLNSKPATGSDSTLSPTMAGPVAAAQAESSRLTRNSSIDSAISAISTKSGSNTNTDGQHGPSEIAHLVKTAGSPETLIQYLLKEKHSQSQQNSQLWRLVDKQRAMILGLNKDLERALKDKEKYRKKLKEVMSLPSAPLSSNDDAKEPTKAPAPSATGADLQRAKEQTITPESPILEAESPRNSPIDISMAPYPITPPADQLSAPHSAVGELLNPAHAMPKPQDHALDKYDHEAEERAADFARKEKSGKLEEPLKEIPYNVSIPPSRSLPSEPPKMPPPNPPVTHLPTVAVLEATPQPDEGLSKFPVPPPRKPPPAPLKLNKELRTHQSPSPEEEEETESDYDDILEVDEIVNDRRGRRRTREEDDRDREIIAIKEAAARSASKKSKSSKSSQPGSPRDTAQVPAPEVGTASLGEMLSTIKTREIPAPLLSPGLPASPRPSNFTSPPLSPRSIPFQAAPLSPRPPRQPIPLPPNTPLATPATHPARASENSVVSEGASSSQRPGAAQQEAGQANQPTPRMSSPNERTEVYRGLVTDEYPDLLLPPNALPSIKIMVASSRMKPSRASMMSLTQLEEDPVFTLAIISRSDNGELWRIEKDLASLTRLDQRLKQCASYTVRAPDRSLFSGHAPAKLDARRTILEQFMDDILDIPFDTKTAIELCKYLSSHVLPPNLDDAASLGDSGSEITGNKIGPDGRPRRSGYLTKKGKNFGGWKARYFVLNGPLLKYFEVPGGAHLGTIKLQGAQIGKQNQNNDNQSPAHAANGDELDNQFRHAFLILEPKKKDTSSHFRHVLCAESDKERDLWVDALMQWVDYRDPEDTEPPLTSRSGHAHDRQTPGHDHRTEHRTDHRLEPPHSGKVRKVPRKSYHHPSDSDTLVGVRYDSTQAGDAPQLTGPARPKTSGGLPETPHAHGFDTFSSSQNKLISGPRDPQPISDLGAWGNKPNLPTADEKKVRKRSFFGFGPKTRSSSEGQDSLFGGSEGGANATPPQNSYQGPVRQAFGAPLGEAVRYCSPTDVNVPLPAVVYRCIQYLDSKNAILEEGIFRLSGSNIVIKQLRERFNTEGDINLTTDRQYYDIHAVASLLKLYLRELPTTILTRDLHNEFLITMEITDHAEKMSALGELVQRLPQANATLLKYLIGFLIKIINNADMNKMTVRNVGIVFSPTLNIPAPVFAMFLQNYEGIFGIDPEVYELPSPVSEPELQRFEAPPRFDVPARPSTAGSSSPHGQMRPNAQRSTPTPPLLVNNAPMRYSPPSSASRPGYDPSASVFDGGYRPPSANDRRMLQASYEDLGSASASYDSMPSSRRRESSIFMGGMMGPQHQGSKSRLREETRF